MMHLCYLNNYLSLRGGSERVMFDEAAMMRRAGHTVSFFSRRGTQDIDDAHAAYFPASVDLDQLNLPNKLRQAPRVIYNRDAARAFRRFLREVRPRLIHAHNIYGGLTTAVLDVAREVGIPVVLTAHDYKLVCPSYLALDHGQVCTACTGGRFYHCLLKRCHKSSLVASALYTAEAYVTTWWRKYASVRYFICPSLFMQRMLLDNGFDPARVLYVPNAVDPSAMTPRIGGGAYALYAGRLSPEKGIMTLLRALEGLEMPLRILGDGPLRATLEAYVAQQRLQDRVTFLGHLSGEALAHAYRQAAFCVVPSEWFENAPMAVLEAFAYGKPVIGAAIGGIPELVEQGATGLLFPPGDIEALRANLATLWREQSSLGDLGRTARRQIETRFSIAQHADALSRLYARLYV